MKPSVTLQELERQLASSGSTIPDGLLAQLRNDSRKGARRLFRRLEKRLDSERDERRRQEAMLRFERELWTSGVDRVAGVDEVGIGPMAGPVVAAAVVFPKGIRMDRVDDSKRLDPAARETLDTEIRAVATGIGMGVVESREVDRLNVYQAGLFAMRLAVESLPTPPEHVLVDARTIPDLTCPQDGLIRGDQNSLSVAAASIIAKVYRDALMKDMDRVYPGYGFGRHKGYCSPEHQRAVRELGPCPAHRRSFDFISEITGEYDPGFYDLKDEIQDIRTQRELALWQSRLRQIRGRLSSRAVRKLQSLALRQAKRAGLVNN